MKLMLALITLLCSLTASAQKVILKFCPPALIDVVGFPTIQAGLEARLSSRWSWYNEVGVKYFEPRQPDTSFVGSGGFKAKTELRYYLNHKRGSHRPIKPMDGKYLAANVFYTYNSFNTQTNYLTGNNNTESKTDCFGVRKTAWGANLAFGWQKSFSRRVFVDLYGGAGIRLRYVRDTHKEYDPDKDILIKSIDLNVRSIQDEVDSKDGFSIAPNLTLGVRLCYRW